MPFLSLTGVRNTSDHILTLFLTHVRDTPEDRAFVFYYNSSHQIELSYRQLFNRASCIATEIKAKYKKVYDHTIPANTRIALCLPRTEWLFCVQLAIALCGATEVPILPDTRLSFLDENFAALGCKLIITDEFLQTLFNHQNNFCMVDDLVSTYTENDVNPKTYPFQLAKFPYCLYTSGTSGGSPKAVMPHHHLFKKNIEQFANRVGTKNKINACTSHITFDVSKTQMWMVLIAGGTFATLQTPRDMNALYNFIKVVAPTAIQLTNTLSSLFSYYCAYHVNSHDQRFLQSMKNLLPMNCGEQLTESVIKFLLTYSTSILDCYGLAETGDCIATRKIESNGDHYKDNCFIPFKHINFYIDDGNRLTIEFDSNLCEGTMGYVIAPKRLSNKFICKDRKIFFITDDEFSIQQSMFGQLYSYIRRKFLADADQVIPTIDTHQFSDFIHSILKSQYSITTADVLISSHVYPPSFIIVTQQPDVIDLNKLNHALVCSLKNPKNLKVSHIYDFNCIPINHHFKYNQIDTAVTIEASNEIEHWICDCLSTLTSTRINTINRTLNFLGVRSKQKNCLLVQIAKKYQLFLTQRFIFNDLTTIQLIAKRIHDLLPSKSQRNLLQADIAGNQPMISPDETRLLHLQTHCQNIVYHIPIPSEINLDNLNMAIDTVVAHHENLRTFFSCTSNRHELIRQISKTRKNCLQTIQLNDDSIKWIIERFRLKTYTDTYPWEIVLYTSESYNHLIICAHHVLTDYTGLNVLIDSINCALANEELKPSPSANQLAKFKATLIQTHNEKNLSYWKRRLSTYKSVPLINEDRLIKVSATHATFLLNTVVKAKLETLASYYNVSLADIYLAAAGILINRFNGEPKFTIAVADNARPPVFAHTFGLAMELRIVEVDTTDNPLVTDLIKRTHDVFYDAAHHHPCGFSEIHHEILKNFPDIALTVETTARQPLVIGNHKLEINQHFPHLQNFSYVFQVDIDGRFSIHAKNGLCSFAGLNNLSSTLEILLEKIATNPSSTIYQLPILTQQAIDVYDCYKEHPPVEIPKKMMLNHFEDAAKSNSSSLLSYIDKESAVHQITKFESNCAANRIARYILSLKLKRQSRIVIYMASSNLSVECFFACLKINMIPIFINPNSESIRQNDQIHTAAPHLVLTNINSRKNSIFTDRLVINLTSLVVKEELDSLSGDSFHIWHR